MKLADTKLLIHHHNAAYLSKEGQIFLPAGIARWVSALAVHFREIGLLLHQSATLQPMQDTAITQPNISLHSLGPPGHYWYRIQRMRRIRRVCQLEGRRADALLIRGLTPRQHIVWKHTPVPRKAFLLVRSPKQPRVLKASFWSLLSFTINKIREHQYARIANTDTLLMANSPVHLPEIERVAGKAAFFVPTNTIQAKEFSPLRIRPVSNPFRLLYVGRLNFLKGLRELLAAVARLQDEDCPCEVDLVGDKTEPAFAQLVILAEELGITPFVRWQGFIPYGPDLFACYQRADAFILPSYTEGFPRVVWEAAAHACPMIITAVGGIPAILDAGVHALLIPPRDVDAITTAVKNLIGDPALRRKLITNAYTLASAYSVEACARKLADTLANEWS